MMKDYSKVISRNLRNILFESGKTQADMSRDLGIGKTTISAWMNGTHIPRMDKIDLLCGYFGCTRADIMEPHDKEYYLRRDTARVAQELYDNPDLRVLFDAARDSTPEDIRRAADILQRFKQTNNEG